MSGFGLIMGSISAGNSGHNIIDELNDNASEIVEEDIGDWILPSLTSFYGSKMTVLARYAYNVRSCSGETVAIQAFRSQAAEALENGLKSFLFREQHWRSGRDIGWYLSGVLNRLARAVRSDVESTRKINTPICPACRHYGNREYLIYESGHLRCPECTERVSKGAREVMRKVFAFHSRKGHRCPECERFIPHSFVDGQYSLSCPYDDCLWFGTRNELSPMAHPLGLTNEPLVSLSTPVDPPSGKVNSDWQDYFKSNDVDAEIHIESQQVWSNEAKVLREVLETQLNRARRQNPGRAFKRLLMYQAFCNLTDRCPEEMVSYLVHRKHSGDQPIQARIFQEFARLVENELPFVITKGGKQYEIESLLDPKLDLFLGVSEFVTEVRENGVIPNHTKETYIGGREMKDFGPCFIGLLIGLENATNGICLMDRVRHYTFSQIRTGLPPGMSVRVKHYRIPSHYEMNGLVPLQRIRRRVVDSVFQRLNGRRRKPGENNG